MTADATTPAAIAAWLESLRQRPPIDLATAVLELWHVLRAAGAGDIAPTPGRVCSLIRGWAAEGQLVLQRGRVSGRAA